MMAYQAYQAWQRSQASAAPQQIPQTADLLAGPQIEEHSHAVLRALIAAAKADGRIDETEKHLISSEIGKHTSDPQLPAMARRRSRQAAGSCRSGAICAG